MHMPLRHQTPTNDGNMRAQIDAGDWSATAIGPQAGWPQGLISAIGIMLAAPQPMLIWWGKELIRFHNDACIPLLGLYHPALFGRPVDEDGGDEDGGDEDGSDERPTTDSAAWPDLGATLAAVMTGGTAIRRDRLEMVVTRDGVAEEVCMALSCSPIPDGRGGTAGVFGICSDETGRMLSDRRLAALAALGDGTRAARGATQTAAAIIGVLNDQPRDLAVALLYSLDGDTRTARLTGCAGLAAGTAVTPWEMDAHGAAQPWPLAAPLAGRRGAVIDLAGPELAAGPWPAASATAGVPQSAVILPLTAATDHHGHKVTGFLVVGLSPRLSYDDGYRRFLDLLARQVGLTLAMARLAELQGEAHKYRTLFNSIDEGFCTIEMLFDADGKPVDYVFLETNAAFARQTGLSDAVGRRMRDLASDHEQHWFDIYGRIALTGTPERFEHRADALGFWYNVYAFRIGDNQVAVLFHDISERKRHEAEIDQSRRRFQALVMATARSVYRISPDWQQMSVMETGLPPHVAEPGGTSLDHSWPDRNWLDRFVLPEDRQMVQSAVQAAIDGRTVFELEHRIRLPDGNIGHMVSRAAPLLAPDGTVSEWFGSGTDVTAPRQAAEKLRATEERLRRFGEASRDVLWIRDADSLQWVYLSPAFETIYGLGREQALTGDNYRRWLDLVMAEDRPRTEAMIARVRGGDHVTFDHRVIRPGDGGIRWLRNTDFPIPDATGRIAFIGGISHDTTEARRVQDALQSSSDRLGIAVKVARLGLWDWDLETGQIHWSDEHYLMEGYAVGEVTPSYEAWLRRIHPEDRGETEAALHEAMADGSDFVSEFRTLHPDGSVHWIAGRGRFFYDAEGRPVRMVGAMMDVTGQREWQERQKVLLAELQHRTRNLMGVIRSIADKTARASTDLGDFQHRFRDRLDALARVQGLLSRLSDHDRVAFDELVRAEIAVMGGPASQVTLTGPSEVRLRSSTVQVLAMALHELATNAVKYGALAQPAGRLQISWWLEPMPGNGDPWLHVDWRERGITMPGAAPPGSGQGSGGQGSGGQGRELIERGLPYQLKAKTSFTLGPDGVHCTIAVPVPVPVPVSPPVSAGPAI